MRERPILFSAPTVRAILAGQKTQTRRIVKGAPDDWAPLQPQVFWTTVVRRGIEEPGKRVYGAGDEDGSRWLICPYGQPGDRLWVRETFGFVTADRDGPRPESIIFRADGNDGWSGQWRPSIHMPRWASRILLEVVSVRVERLQAIDDQDAEAEGAEPRQPLMASGIVIPGQYRLGFRDLWNSINGPDAWNANPWVWVVEFKWVEVAHG